MLVLKRRDGHWVEITHKNGDILRIRTCITNDGGVNLIFDDSQRNFEINRPERKITTEKIVE